MASSSRHIKLAVGQSLVWSIALENHAQTLLRVDSLWLFSLGVGVDGQTELSSKNQTRNPGAPDAQTRLFWRRLRASASSVILSSTLDFGFLQHTHQVMKARQVGSWLRILMEFSISIIHTEYT